MSAAGQNASVSPGAAVAPAWQRCAALVQDDQARLACFDRLVSEQSTVAPAGTAAAAAPVVAPAASTPPADPLTPATRVIAVATEDGCRDRQYSDLARFWELETGTDCGTFGIRSYRPISLSFIASNSVNNRPGSGNPANSADENSAFRKTETRVQLSVRSKLAQGLLTAGNPTRKDSLWFGYTQQSYWQLFNGAISRPFRSTDHEPELIYVYPIDVSLPQNWRVRYGGVGLVHQSNGQSLPYSRSWNRVYLMAGLERDNRFRLQARIWQRLNENAESDDNPHISDFIGRAEAAMVWNVNRDNTVGLTLRHSMRDKANGSWRFEWMQTLGRGTNENSSLRLHTQLFTGYGDSLIDYNRRRTVFSVGLSLVDF